MKLATALVTALIFIGAVAPATVDAGPPVFHVSNQTYDQHLVVDVSRYNSRSEITLYCSSSNGVHDEVYAYPPGGVLDVVFVMPTWPAPGDLPGITSNTGMLCVLQVGNVLNNSRFKVTAKDCFYVVANYPPPPDVDLCWSNPL